MNILVDTQILVWSFDINSPLSQKHKELLENTANRVFVSQISLMELAIKKSLNKLPDFLPDLETVTKHFMSNGFELLPLKDEHIFNYQKLPLFPEHKDPFDRFLISTAMQENLAIITTDSKFELYSSQVKIL